MIRLLKSLCNYFSNAQLQLLQSVEKLECLPREQLLPVGKKTLQHNYVNGKNNNSDTEVGVQFISNAIAVLFFLLMQRAQPVLSALKFKLFSFLRNQLDRQSHFSRGPLGCFLNLLQSICLSSKRAGISLSGEAVCLESLIYGILFPSL